MDKFVDLHTHTNASDGRDSPTQVVSKAAELGLSAIAITDHDTLKGLETAQVEGQRLGVEVIRGCELSVDSEMGEVHIVALWVPKQAYELENALEQLRENRANRNKIIVQKLNDMGIDIHYEEVLCATRSPDNAQNISMIPMSSVATRPKNIANAVGRPHIATVLLQKGYVSNIREAFSKYIGDKCPAFERKALFDVQKIMRLLVDVQATICLAHPGLIKCTHQWLENYVIDLKTIGLSGLEVYHSEHDAKITKFLLRLAHKHDLAVSGGSDYHGAVKPHIALGFGRGDLRVRMQVLDNLKKNRLALGYTI